MATKRSAQGSRAKVVSSFTLVKGAMIEETYAVFAAWDFERTKRENLDRLREENFIGAAQRDLAAGRRQGSQPALRPRRPRPAARPPRQARAATSTSWKPLLLWHMTRDEFLLRDFLVSWLFPAYEAGTYRVRPEDLLAYLQEVRRRAAASPSTPGRRAPCARVAAGLLRIAVDFGLLRARSSRSSQSYHLPERASSTCCTRCGTTERSPRKLIDRSGLADVPDATARTSSASSSACTSSASSSTRSPAASCS